MTARKISLVAACVIILSILGSHWLFSTLLFNEQQSTVRIIVASVTGVITYFVTDRVITSFLSKRVKHLYQLILKPEPDENVLAKLNSDKPMLKQVEDEISDYLKMQNQQLNTLRDMEKYRQDFVGNVAHELKTPIFNIQGYVHTLKDGALDDPTVNRTYLQRASDNIDRMIKIIEDLDSIYKLESHQSKLEWQKINIHALVNSMVEEMKLTAKEKKTRIEVKSDVSSDQMIFADPDYLKQVFINLIENSIKYGNENGHTFIILTDLEDQILIEVQDDGNGIESKHLRHLFDRFYRVDKARSRQAGGSGLGLSIVKHIIEAHNQTIKVRSTIGEGTTFSFTLPKKSPVID